MCYILGSGRNKKRQLVGCLLMCSAISWLLQEIMNSKTYRSEIEVGVKAI